MKSAPQHPVRVLARQVVYHGEIYPMSIADVSDGTVRITPFVRETARTVFHPGTVEVKDTDAGPICVYKL